MSVPRASISAGAGMWAFIPQPLPELVRIGDRVAALSFDWHACLDPMLCCRLANSEIRANSLPAFESLGRLFGFCRFTSLCGFALGHGAQLLHGTELSA